jgi:hypothetical protein
MAVLSYLGSLWFLDGCDKGTTSHFVHISWPWQWLDERSGKNAWAVHGKSELTETDALNLFPWRQIHNVWMTIEVRSVSFSARGVSVRLSHTCCNPLCSHGRDFCSSNPLIAPFPLAEAMHSWSRTCKASLLRTSRLPSTPARLRRIRAAPSTPLGTPRRLKTATASRRLLSAITTTH